MLPLLYPDPDTRRALLSDPATAPIPLLHRELFRFAEKFVRRSWAMTSQDLDRLREADLPESEIVHWASLGSTQSWFTMSADGGGVPLDDGTLTGSVVGRRREEYEAQRGGLLAASPGAGTVHPLPADDGVSWTDLDETDEACLDAADWARERYGFVPNLFRAVSLRPAFFRRHQLALELLEAPQSESLSARQHAMVRVLVSKLNRSRYSEPTSTALWLRVGGEPALLDRLREDPQDSDWSPEDRAVLRLATKFARNTYKITEKDAGSLRDVGLDDEAYVDILNTVSIQTSLDRLANALGVRPDSAPLLPSSGS